MSEKQYVLRERCRQILAHSFPHANFISIDKCCNEWVEKGNLISTGIVQYFKYYFLHQ